MCNIDIKNILFATKNVQKECISDAGCCACGDRYTQKVTRHTRIVRWPTDTRRSQLLRALTAAAPATIDASLMLGGRLSCSCSLQAVLLRRLRCWWREQAPSVRRLPVLSAKPHSALLAQRLSSHSLCLFSRHRAALSLGRTSRRSSYCNKLTTVTGSAAARWMLELLIYHVSESMTDFWCYARSDFFWYLRLSASKCVSRVTILSHLYRPEALLEVNSY